jgi:hypothetical protein
MARCTRARVQDVEECYVARTVPENVGRRSPARTMPSPSPETEEIKLHDNDKANSVTPVTIIPLKYKKLLCCSFNLVSGSDPRVMRRRRGALSALLPRTFFSLLWGYSWRVT